MVGPKVVTTNALTASGHLSWTDIPRFQHLTSMHGDWIYQRIERLASRLSFCSHLPPRISHSRRQGRKNSRYGTSFGSVDGLTAD
ncbi:hypothetical protein HETIRDRAFT_418208 [Heterobasidion irregulare TC 32-1]|uniref:Uncharacterized protein n=1 Tax=Heterobasidion irregulare (strain TC 32-1) TaxID=747525 RepID=W4KAC7_HETIT|nr:uncharacterized protein HETIRDRAFT_418208 [Heterobasidion irregulare TC 32-1]ETW82285.1 hypothetical protein HETIRDRAFT_418208 [Heterobasidion irregulare TC 32-1]